MGHEAASGLPSHFVALNLERRVVILELPGGDATQTRTIVGPYLFGAGEDLTPVLLRFADVNADQRLDMLVNVKQEEMVYINDAAKAMLSASSPPTSWDGYNRASSWAECQQATLRCC